MQKEYEIHVGWFIFAILYVLVRIWPFPSIP